MSLNPAIAITLLVVAVLYCTAGSFVKHKSRYSTNIHKQLQAKVAATIWAKKTNKKTNSDTS